MNTIISSCIRSPADIMTSILFEDEKNPIAYVRHSFLAHLSVVGDLHWFYDLAVINSSATDINVHISL